MFLQLAEVSISCRLLQMKQAGEEVGIQFSFTNTSFPNTLKAHALLDFAESRDGGARQNDVAEMLFKVVLTNSLYLLVVLYCSAAVIFVVVVFAVCSCRCCSAVVWLLVIGAVAAVVVVVLNVHAHQTMGRTGLKCES